MSKPLQVHRRPVCARDGCTARAWIRFCSRRCAALHRIAHGWQPHASLTPEQRLKAGRMGGRASSRARQKRRMHVIADRLAPLLGERLIGGLEPADVVRVKTLLVRAYRMGRREAKQAIWHQRQAAVATREGGRA